MRYEPDAPEVQETLTMIRLLCDNPSLPNMRSYLQNIDIQDSDAHETLHQIFEDISTMTMEEMDTFAAALDAESINGLDDVLLVEQSLDAFTFVPDVHSVTELGRYVVESEFFEVSERVAPYLDYAKVGVSFYDAHGGAFGPKGYAQRTGSINPVFKAYIQSQVVEDQTIVFLPVSERQLQRLNAQLCASETLNMYITTLECAKPNRQDLEQMPYMDAPTLREANELAKQLNRIHQQDGTYLKFLAALEAEQIGTFAGALEVAKNLDDYTRFTGSLEDYGKDVLSRMGTPKQAIDSIEGYMDLEDFGRIMMAEEDVRQTQFGLIRKDWGSSFPKLQQNITMGGMT